MGSTESTRTGRRWARWAAPTCLACGWLACASGPPPAPPPPEWNPDRVAAADALESLLARAPAAAAGVLELRLAFEAGADLDLYVTDPRLETLYYANTPVRSGGELLADQRCDTEPNDAARIEVVRFTAPPAGRYRVGVDHPASCEGGAEVAPGVEAAPYVLSIETAAGRQTLRGLSERLRFDPIVIEFDWP